MEKRHQEFLQDTMPDLVREKQIICLNIPTEYRYNDPELIELLENGVGEWV